MQQVTTEEWQDKYHEDFITLSIDWLEKYVSVEPIDLEILNNPEKHIFFMWWQSVLCPIR